MLKSGVPVVFAVIISSAEHCLCNEVPLVLECSPSEEQNPILIHGPRMLDDHWIEVIVPSLSDLLSTSLLRFLGKQVPV